MCSEPEELINDGLNYKDPKVISCLLLLYICIAKYIIAVIEFYYIHGLY